MIVWNETAGAMPTAFAWAWEAPDAAAMPTQNAVGMAQRDTHLRLGLPTRQLLHKRFVFSRIQAILQSVQHAAHVVLEECLAVKP
jgi:hypothetical protein